MIVYDAEIVKCIPERGRPNEEGLEYCKGWEDHTGMGISVVCAYDLRHRRARVYLADNLGQFARDVQGRVLAGFNTDGFDSKLLAAAGIDVSGNASYDLQTKMRVACGEPAEYVYGVTKKGRGLDAIAKANGVAGKSGHGELAPVLWQRGKFGEVIDYCMWDVGIVVELLRKIVVNGTLVDPLDPTRHVTVEKPRWT